MEKYFYRLIGRFPPAIVYHLDLMWSLAPRDYWLAIFRGIRDWWRVRFVDHCLRMAYRLGLIREMPFSMELEEYEKALDDVCIAMLSEATRKNVTAIRFSHSPSNSLINIEFLVCEKFELYRTMKQSAEIFELGGGDLITWMKLQANLDIAERHAAQSGEFLYAPLSIRLLVETMPTDKHSCEDAIVQIDYRSEGAHRS